MATTRGLRARVAATLIPVCAGTSGFVIGAPRANADFAVVATYDMNETATGSPRTMVDSGPFGLHGRIGDSITIGPLGGGLNGYQWAYTPPDSPPMDSERLATVASTSHLDPGAVEFAIEIRYRTTRGFGNVIQKGQSATSGGYWKVEQPDGFPTCLFRRNLSDQAAVVSPHRTNDGAWHTIRCERHGTYVRMLVDGVEVDRRNRAVGTIVNSSPMTIGGKISCNQVGVGCDYFTGEIDWVRIEKDIPVPSDQPPTMRIAQPACAGLTCTYDSSASSDPDGAIVDRSWDFGDGTQVRDHSEIAVHSFPAAGTYKVTLVGTDNNGATSAPASVAVTVADSGTSALDPPVMGAAMVPLPPQRVFDTRPDEPAPGPKGAVRGGTSIDVAVTGVAGVPTSGVTAVAMNITSIALNAPSYVSVRPADAPEAVTSSLNLIEPGEVRANMVIVPIGADGRVNLATLRDAHLLGDIVGYFAGSFHSSDSGRIVTQVPQRLFDTRPGPDPGPKGQIPAAGTITMPVLGHAGVPSDSVTAVILNVTATNATAAGYVTVWPSGYTRPVASTININHAGESVANQIIVPIGTDGTITMYTLSATDLVADVVGYVTGPGAPVTTTGLFIPLQPARLFDTRPGEPGGGPKGLLEPDTTIRPQIAGTAGVPETAGAVVLNVTLIGENPGFTTIWPTGSPRPPTSNINVSTIGDIRANSAIVRLGQHGRIDAYMLSTGHLLADTSGYLLR